MFDLSIVNESKNRSFRFTNNNFVILENVDGFMPPNAEISISKGIGDGGRVAYSRIPERNIVLSGSILQSIAYIKDQLFHLCRIKDTVRVYYKSETKDCYIDGVIESININSFANPATFQISIICPLPLWQNNYLESSVIANVEDKFEFPYEFESDGKSYGELKALNEAIIYNRGDIDSGVTIRLTARGGAVETPRIDNFTTGQSMGLNISIADGETVEINTRVGEKTIRKGEDNIFKSLAVGSTWITVISGENYFVVDATEGVEYLQVEITYRQQYQGV